MVEVRKKEKETSESLIKRFTRQLQSSGVLPKARKRRFYAKKKTRRILREEALYRDKVKKEADRLKKMGKFDEEAFKEIKKKIAEK